MTGREHEIAAYYQILFELLIFVAFVIVLKIVMLLLMAKMSVMLSDNPEETRQKQEEKKARSTFDQTMVQKWLRLGAGFLVTVSGLYQIQPRMVSIPGSTVTEDLGFQSGVLHGLVAPFANLWANHSTWMNVTSVGVQLLIGLILLTTSNRIAVWIVSGVGALIALYDFIAMTGFGGLFGGHATVLGASAVRGLAYLVLFLYLFAPTGDWKSKRPVRWLRFGVVAYWVLGAILQLIPADGFFKASGWNQLLGTNRQAMMPGWVTHMAQGTAQMFDSSASVLNVIIAVLMLIFAVGVLMRNQWAGVAKVIEVLSVIWIVLTWVFLGHFGFETVYVFPMDAGPVIALATALLWVGNGDVKVGSGTTAGTRQSTGSASS